MQRLSLIAFIFATFAALAQAQDAPVTAEGGWARSTVPGQSATGAFMRLTAKEHLTLVGVESPVAGLAELHQMKMEGDVMQMRPVPALDLAAGRAFELRPGGYHLMLQGLKAPLKPGTQVPLTLTFRNDKGQSSKLALTVPVLTRAPDGAAVHKH